MMESTLTEAGQLVETGKRIARRLLIIGENRLELLMVEVQEERAHLLRAILMALGVAGFGLLAALAFTATLVVLLWPYAPVAVLLVLTSLYAAAAIWLYRRLAGLLRNWQNLPATLDQLRKDRAGLEKTLE